MLFQMMKQTERINKNAKLAFKSLTSKEKTTNTGYLPSFAIC
ncbi:hypothetical protein HMPREF9442_03188 [Paraprevotella xylaniphila YIT 11841]|uniref:Uncharacterized protein n=1 Tax=Paraprevotella xylaniphila YIT 11841 TaxID=762982 RepID=F3QY95_9BACT|nr:hypothetical protein HMPREF9442_03188 [Paraprevotella xylaniphila YIT 11841]